MCIPVVVCFYDLYNVFEYTMLPTVFFESSPSTHVPLPPLLTDHHALPMRKKNINIITHTHKASHHTFLLAPLSETWGLERNWPSNIRETIFLVGL